MPFHSCCGLAGAEDIFTDVCTLEPGNRDSFHTVLGDV